MDPEEVGLAPHPFDGLVLQIGDTERSPQPLGWISKQGPCFTSVEEDGGDKKLVELEFVCKADGVAPLDHV